MLIKRALSTNAAARGVVDIAIVGGGMTGAALAAALGEDPARGRAHLLKASSVSTNIQPLKFPAWCLRVVARLSAHHLPMALPPLPHRPVRLQPLTR